MHDNGSTYRDIARAEGVNTGTRLPWCCATADTGRSGFGPRLRRVDADT